MRWVLGVLACAAALWASPDALAADGQLAAIAGSRLVTLNPDGSGLRTLWTAPADTPLSRPAWSADGNRIALADGGRIAVYDIRSGALSAITAGDQDQDPAWLGDRIAFRRGLVLMSVAADGSDPRAFGLALDLGATRVTFAPDGARVAVVIPPALRVVGLDGLGGQLLTTGVRGAPAWSPDSSRVAYSGAGTAGALRIYALTPPEAAATPISPDGGVDTAPAFSPDGTRIVFVHQGAALDVAGPGGVRALLAGPFADPAWQPCTSATAACTSVAPPVCAAPASVTTQAGRAVELP